MGQVKGHEEVTTEGQVSLALLVSSQPPVSSSFSSSGRVKLRADSPAAQRRAEHVLHHVFPYVLDLRPSLRPSAAQAFKRLPTLSHAQCLLSSSRGRSDIPTRSTWKRC